MESVVLVHASGLSSRQWSRWSFPGFRPVAFDLWGCGASADWPGPWPFRLRADLARVLGALVEHGPAHLVGHSYGGALALYAAAERPDLARSVAVYEPPLFGLLTTGDPADRELATRSLPPGFRDPASEGSEAWLAAFVDWWNGPGAYRALAAPVRDALLRARREVWGQVLDLIDDPRPLDSYRAIPRILALRGATTPPAVARGLERLATLPNVTLEQLPDLPHMGPIVRPDLVGGRVLAFLQGQPSRSTPA